MPGSNDAALSHASYWDERYLQADGGSEPTHEWFRSFSDLAPFFESHLFSAPGLTPTDDPLVLHLGSGDSVRRPRFIQSSSPPDVLG
jgi:hypothetical protein